MAKPKSMKLRTLATLHALFKYSDAEHRMNTVKLNEHLKPYYVDCMTSRVLSDTVRIMREFGIDVRSKGEWDNQGVWIENRPLPQHELHRLIFAVTTNPHLSKEQATEILHSLKPFVTVYQEPLLKGFVENDQEAPQDDQFYWTYSVIQTAISAKRRVRYAVDYVKYHGDTQTVERKEEWMTLFTPKCLYQAKGQLYMVGYNNTDRRIDAVNLQDITSIKLAFKHKDPKAEQVSGWIADIEPQEWVPGERKQLIYRGPAVFKCRGQYVTELFRRFGAPDGLVVKDVRCRTTYAVQEAEISSETLFWLSQVPEYGIRIIGPEPLVEVVQDYYQRVSFNLLKPTIPANKTKESNGNE